MEMINQLNKIRLCFLTTLLLATIVNTSCSIINKNDDDQSLILGLMKKSSPKWLTPYRPDVVQGNYISESMILLLKKGQTKKQVLNILGTPLVVDPFNPNRWDYVFDINKNESVKENRIFFVKFVDEKLSNWEGDAVENSLEEKILPK